MRSAADLLALGAAGLLPNLAYLVVGLALARGLGSRARGAERLAVGFVLGTGACSLALLLLRALSAPVPLAGCAAVSIAGAWLLRDVRGEPPRPPRRAWVRAIAAASIAAAALLFVAALGPETSWDGFEYHLPLVRAWTEGPVRALPGFLDAELRAGVDLLYAPAVAAGMPDAAAAVSACFALALAALIRAEAGRRATPGAGAVAGAMALVVPFTVQNASSTYVDLGVGAYGFLALLEADRWNRTGDRRALRVAALCLGFAANAKLHGAALAPAALMLVLLGGRRPAPRALAGAGALTALVAAPWFAKAAVTAGNPLFPLFGRWLGAGPTTPELIELRRFRLTTDFPADRDLAGFARYLASVTFGRNPHVSGLIGPLPLALGPFAWRRPGRATLVLAAVVAALAVLQFATAPALRFGAPLLPFLAIAAAVGGARVARSGAVPRAVLAAALALLAVHHAASLLGADLPRVAALRDPAAYERAVFPDQAALREVVARAEPVVAIPGGAVAWMDRPVYNLLWERNGELFFDALRWNREGERRRVARTPPDAALALLRERGVRSLVLPVQPPLPGDGTVRHPTVDAWIRSGRARLRADPAPPAARAGRVWVLVDLLPPRPEVP